MPSLFLSSVALVVTAALGREEIISGPCLSRFRTDPQHFDACKKSICFLFREEEPFIVLDPRMKNEDNQTIFRCRDRASYFPDLHGTMFKIKDSIPVLHDARCVYAGDKCTYNGMLQFMEEHVATREKHWFAVSGLLFQTPFRLSRHSTPSVPFMETEMVIVGKRDDRSISTAALSAAVFSLDFRNFLCLVGSFLGLYVLCFLLIRLSYDPLNRDTAMHEDLQESDKHLGGSGYTMLLQEDVQRWNKLAATALRTAFSGFWVIALLYYEIAVVQYMFMESSKSLTKDVQSLSESDLQHFVVSPVGVADYFFRRTVDPEGKYGSLNVPWKLCSNMTDCFSRLMNDKLSANYLVTLRFCATYYLKKEKVCDHLKIYSVQHPSPSYPGGWYLNSNVPKDVRLKIDRSILSLRLTGAMKRVLSKDGDELTSLDCGQPAKKIDAGFLGPILAVVLGPFFLIAGLSLVVIYMTRRRFQYRQVIGL